jgi:hypothetical protein
MIYTAVGLFAGSQAIESWRRHEVGMARWLGLVAATCAALLALSSVFSRPPRR